MNTIKPTQPTSGSGSVTSRLVRQGPRPMALEQRFMFDGAAMMDAVDTLDHSVPDATVLNTANVTDAPLLLVESAPAVVQTSAQEAETLVKDYLASHNDAELFALFNGGQATMDTAWTERLNSLRNALTDGSFHLNVVAMDSASQFTAIAAFAAEGPNSEPTIFINSQWFGMFDAPDATRALVEELGHAIDHYLNPTGDTAGDEGEVFADVVIDGSVSGDTLSSLSTQSDQGTVTVGSVSYDVEFATFSFTNAYQMITDVNNDGIVQNTENWAEKEQESHTLLVDSDFSAGNDYGGLGAVTINDDTNSSQFSGNDVSAIGINIGGTDYYGWISRPLKIQGSVVGFYFWTDQDFTNLSTAQADGNQDADSADAPSDPDVTDNKGFILVVNQSYFNSLIATMGTTTVTGTGTAWSALAAGTYNSIEVGSSSDRVDSALNTLVNSNAVPLAMDDTTTGTPDASIAGRPAREAGYNVSTVNATGNVLTNDSDSNSDTLTVSGISSSTTTGSSVSPTGSGSYTVNGSYGTLTIYANGTYSYAVNNSSAAVNALNVGDTLNDVFNYTASDGKGGTDTAKLTITINGSDDAPVANPDYNIAKESTTSGVSGFNYTGYSATGNVLPNDTDVDDTYQTQSTTTLASGDYSIVGASVTGTIASSNVAVTPGTYTLSFSLSNGFSSIAAGDEIYVHLGAKTPATGDVYTGLYTYNAGTGAYTLITVQSKDTGTSTIVFSATPEYYWDTSTSTFKSIGSLNTFFSNNPNLIFQNTTDTTPTVGETYTQKNGDKYATTSAVTGSGYTTITGLNAQSGTITTGMTVTGTGVPAGTTVTNIVVTNGVITSITLSSDQITSPNGTVFSFTGASGVAQTLQGAHGTLVLNTNGSYTYTPTTDNSRLSGGQSAVEAFNYTMQDSQGVQSSSTLYITVYGTGNNDPVAQDDVANGSNGTVAAVEQGFNTNTSTELSATVNASGSVLTNDLEKFGAANAGTDYVTQASKSDGTGTAAVTAGGVDIVGVYGTLTIKADGTYTYAVNNSNGTVDALLPGETLTESFRYTVANTLSPSGTATAKLTITINGANDAPVALNDTGASLTEDFDSATSGFVLLNDSDVDAHDSKTVTKAGTSTASDSVSSGTTSSNGLVVNGTYGQLVIGADGSYTYTLGVTAGQISALQALTTADHMAEVFTYEITDTHGGTDTASLSFTVNGANEPPINTVPASVTTSIDTAHSFSGAVSVADADSNLDLIVLHVDHGVLSSSVTLPTGLSATWDAASGNLTITADTTANMMAGLNTYLAGLVYTPTVGYSGTDNLTIYSRDTNFSYDSDGIPITITTTDPLPVASDDSTTYTPGSPITFNVLSNDTSGDTVVTSTVRFDSNNSTSLVVAGEGSWSINTSTGEITFTPEAGFTGSPTPVIYKVADAQGNYDTASLTLNADAPPVATNDSGTFVPGSPVTVDVLSNDTTGDTVVPTTVVFTSVNATDSGKTLIVANEGTWSIDPTSGAITFTPLAGFTGNPSAVEYQVADAQGNVDTASVSLAKDSVDLVTTKVLTSTDATPDEGDTVVFTVTVRNNGSAEATGVNLTDSWPSGLTFISTNASQGSYNSSTGLWTIGTLNNGQSVTLVLTGTVKAGESGNTLTNTVSAATGDQPDPTNSGNDLTESVAVNEVAAPEAPIVVPPEPAPDFAPTPAPAEVPLESMPPFDSATVMQVTSPTPQLEVSTFPVEAILTSDTGFPVLVVDPANTALPPNLILANSVTDQFADPGVESRFALPYDTFAHTKAEAQITLVAKQQDGTELPTWVVFDPQSGTFTVTPPADLPEKLRELKLMVIARDQEGREAVAPFRFFVGDEKAKPKATGRLSLSEQLKLAGKRGQTPWAEFSRAPLVTPPAARASSVVERTVAHSR